VYTTEDVLVTPHHGTDLKTNMTWTRLSTPKAKWLVDARELRPGVQLARTLLSNRPTEGTVHVLNMSDVPQKIRRRDLSWHS